MTRVLFAVARFTFRITEPFIPPRPVGLGLSSGFVVRYSSSKMPGKKTFERLPKNVIPRNYNLRLIPDLASFTFTGSEAILVDVKEATSKIKLNSAEIQISKALFVSEGKEIEAQVEYCKDEETATLSLPSEISAGASGHVKLEFQGELNDRMKGFYRARYTTPEGEERYSATTQFEATDARRAFPCWDEPALKATFDVTLVVPKDRIGLSNMPVVKEEESKVAGCKELTFATSPIMSTYLLAFIVGEYDYVEDTDSNGVKIRVYSQVGKKERGQFALEVAVKTLPFYSKYFNIPYPLPKMDLIAIPDFAAGAMENWGLVTYREVALLVDPKESSAATKQWVALVVGHELAHQWFGNLVTMEWWTHLWLNEGFASWIEYLCVDKCFPEYDIWTQFVVNDHNRALDLDSLRNSHPIEVEVGHPDEVDEIFDLISYCKGCSIINMLHQWIGDEDFRKSMSQYLGKFAYKNAVTEDLWAALEAGSDKPVTKVMTSWTKQMGYPVIKVSSVQDGDNRKLVITQKKFCADGKMEGFEDMLWMVPITVSSKQSPSTPVVTALLDQKTMELTVKNVKPGDWIKLNVGSVCVYRVQYSAEMLEPLFAAVKNQELPPRDRLGLQSDFFALAVSGDISTVDVLKLLECYKSERCYPVWNDICSNLSSLSTLLQYSDFYPLMQIYCRELLTDIKEHLGWDPKPGESHLDSMLRTVILNMLAKNDDKQMILEAKKRFEAHVNQSQMLHADLRVPVYVSILSDNEEERLDQLLELKKGSDMQEEQTRILRCVGAVTSDSLLKRVMDLALSDDVRSQDTMFVLGGATRSRAGREVVWAHVRERWDTYLKRYGSTSILSRIIQLTEHFASTDKAQEVEKFFTDHPCPSGERSVKQSVENITLNAQWLERDGEKIHSYLTSRP